MASSCVLKGESTWSAWSSTTWSSIALPSGRPWAAPQHSIRHPTLLCPLIKQTIQSTSARLSYCMSARRIGLVFPHVARPSRFRFPWPNALLMAFIPVLVLRPLAPHRATRAHITQLLKAVLGFDGKRSSVREVPAHARGGAGDGDAEKHAHRPDRRSLPARVRRIRNRIGRSEFHDETCSRP